MAAKGTGKGIREIRAQIKETAKRSPNRAKPSLPWPDNGWICLIAATVPGPP